MPKSSILSFDPDDLIKKQNEEEVLEKKVSIRLKKLFEFFVVSPLLIMFLWKFSISSMFDVKGIDYLQSLCLNGIVKVLMRRVEDDKDM